MASREEEGVFLIFREESLGVREMDRNDFFEKTRNFEKGLDFS
mgnify:CR=1 FL=1